MKGEKTTYIKLLGMDEETITIGGYGVVFGGEDLEETTFTPETDYMPDLVPTKIVMYDHGLQDEVKHHKEIASRIQHEVDGLLTLLDETDSRGVAQSG